MFRRVLYCGFDFKAGATSMNPRTVTKLNAFECEAIARALRADTLGYIGPSRLAEIIAAFELASTVTIKVPRTEGGDVT